MSEINNKTKTPKKVLIDLDPKYFFSEAQLVSLNIKNKEDRKQFIDWAVLFKDGADKVTLQDGRVLYSYFEYSAIVFDGVDGSTRILKDGTIQLSKGNLSFDESIDASFPVEKWTVVAKAHMHDMLGIIVHNYNNVDNRYKCMFHGEIRYKRHNGPWTKK